MSIEAMTFAFNSGLPPGPRFVLLVRCDRAGDYEGEDWTCYPSIKRVVRRSGYSEATVERHLNCLELNGWLTRKRRKRPDGRYGVYEYVLHRAPDRRAQLWSDRQAKAKPACRLRAGPDFNLHP